MKSNEHRINIIIGQLEGVKKKMTQEKIDCFSLITQLKAVKAATSSLMETIIEKEFNKCLLDSQERKKEDLQKFFKEIIKK
jgi:DNA-binding FrmR family transcriptional regulator